MRNHPNYQITLSFLCCNSVAYAWIFRYLSFTASQNEMPTSVGVFESAPWEFCSFLLSGLCTCGQLVATTSCLLRPGGGNWNFDFDDYVVTSPSVSKIMSSFIPKWLHGCTTFPYLAIQWFRSNLLGNVWSRIDGSYTTGGSAHWTFAGVEVPSDAQLFRFGVHRNPSQQHLKWIRSEDHICIQDLSKAITKSWSHSPCTKTKNKFFAS